MKAVAEEHDGFRLGGDPRHHISELQRRLQHDAKGKAKGEGGGEQKTSSVSAPNATNFSSKKSHEVGA